MVNTSEADMDDLSALEALNSTGLAELTVLFEERRGIPYARNRALDFARGKRSDWLAFIDDDCTPARDWLGTLCEGIADTSADAVAGGWSIHPDGNPSPWLPSTVWGQREYLRNGRAIQPGGYLTTAYTRSVMFSLQRCEAPDALLRFDVSRTDRGGSDVVFFEEFVERGGKIVYWPLSHVVEFFGGERLFLRWHIKRKIRNTQFRLQRNPRWLLQRVLPTGLRFVLSLPAKVLSALFFGLNRFKKQTLQQWIGQFAMGSAPFLAVALVLVGVYYADYSPSKKWELGRRGRSDTPSAVRVNPTLDSAGRA